MFSTCCNFSVASSSRILPKSSAEESGQIQVGSFRICRLFGPQYPEVEDSGRGREMMGGWRL
jgi:hypothetical protein